MKLSEAIVLGSTVLTPKAGRQIFPEENAGCALGMAAVANGCIFSPVVGPLPPGESGRALGVAGVWGDWILQEVSRPCSCRSWWFKQLSVPPRMPIQDVITHLFDFHVMGKKDWTLDRLVEWVRSVEPEEGALNTSPKIDVYSEYISDFICSESGLLEAALKKHCADCDAIIARNQPVYWNDVPPSCRPQLALLGLLTNTVENPELEPSGD